MSITFGSFRFKHVAVRSHAEAIGFFQSGPLENYLTNEKLNDLLNVQQRLINWRFPLGCKYATCPMLQYGCIRTFVSVSTSFFDYFGAIISYLVLAIAIFLLDSYEDVDPVDLTGIVSRVSRVGFNGVAIRKLNASGFSLKPCLLLERLLLHLSYQRFLEAH